MSAPDSTGARPSGGTVQLPAKKEMKKDKSSSMSVKELLMACLCIDGGGAGRHWERPSLSPPPAPPPSRANSGNTSRRGAVHPRPRQLSSYELRQRMARRPGEERLPRHHTALPTSNSAARRRQFHPIVTDSPTARIVQPESSIAEQQREIEAKNLANRAQDKLHLEKIRQAQHHGKEPEGPKAIPAVAGDLGDIETSSLPMNFSPRERQPTVPDLSGGNRRGTGGVAEVSTP